MCVDPRLLLYQNLMVQRNQSVYLHRLMG